jgi:hypothetical protein
LIFVDTNVLIDVATGNPTWSDWSRHAIADAHARGPLLINAIVYAAFAIGFEAQSDCDAEIEKFDLTLADLPKSAALSRGASFPIVSAQWRSPHERAARLLCRRSRERRGGAIAHARRAALSRLFSGADAHCAGGVRGWRIRRRAG